MDIKYYRKMKNIERLSMMFTNRKYNLLEHSYMVTVLFRKFASLEDVAYDMSVLDLVMNHDAVESVTSDLPWPVKSFSIKTSEAWGEIEKEVIKKNFQLEKYSDLNLKSGMTALQYELFKICDILDLWLFIKEEIAIGNRTIDILEVENNCKLLMSNVNKFPHINKFIKEYEF